MPRSRSTPDDIDFVPLMGPTARLLLGEPNKELSKPAELRFGTHGSMSVNLRKGVFFDHEAGAGGGVIELVTRIRGGTEADAFEWLQEQGIAPKANGREHGKSRANQQWLTIEDYPYGDEGGNVIFVVERQELRNADGSAVAGKDGKPQKAFKQKRPDPERPGVWIYDKKGCRVVPFLVPELTEAVASGYPIFVVEGERKVNLLRAWGVNATCSAGGSGKWKSEHSAFLKDAEVVIVPDNDEAGYKHLQEVGASLTGIAKSIRVLMLPGLPTKGDIIDWSKAGGTREQLDELFEKAPAWVPFNAKEAAKDAAKTREDEIIAALSELEPGIEYARRRKEAAKEFSVSPTDIDAEVERYREDKQATPLYGHWVTEPSAEPVEGDDLIRDIINKLRKHVVCTQEQALTVALWVMLAWVHDAAAVHSPILVMTSAEPESGKTTMLKLVSFLAPQCIASVEISKAALYRAIKLWSPSFVIDEFDDVLRSPVGDRAELRSVINSGHTRGDGVLRCITDEHKPELFPTFCPKSIGMVGRKLPAATLSRCIFVELRRRRRDESCERFIHRDDDELSNLRSRLRRWATDNVEALCNANPPMDEFNRRGDNWRLQFAIADLCSKDRAVDPEWGEKATDWGERARATASKVEAIADSRTLKVKLLEDIRTTFGSIKGDDVIGSEELTSKLTADEDSEWKEFKNGKPLTQAGLARMLKEYKIIPVQVKPKALGERQVRGYRRADFEDAWSRYL